MKTPIARHCLAVVALVALCAGIGVPRATAAQADAFFSDVPGAATQSPIVTLTFNSIGAWDGWVLESSETSGKGGTKESAANTLRMGDDAARRQYRSILTFRTGPALPDAAVITAVRVTFRRQLIKGPSDPLTSLGGLMVDMMKGMFGTAALELTDFQATGPLTSYRTFGPFKPAGNTVGWYGISLPPAANNYINKLSSPSGLTQIRLRFYLDDNNDAVANYLSIFSGDAPISSQPQLIVRYYVP